MKMLTSLEICAGGGGQAIGLERAGFCHVALVDNDLNACATLRLNRPSWNVIHNDVRDFDATPYVGVDLFAGGVPCPPFSKAGLQLGKDDERDLFPQALRMVRECKPRAIMLENVRGLLDKGFTGYRDEISNALRDLGYVPHWHLIHAAEFGVPQLRPRVVMVALLHDVCANFHWPLPQQEPAKTVGDTLYDIMASSGWSGVDAWRLKAGRIAPTIVGGSKKHGGPDLGPTRAKKEWLTLGVNGTTIGNMPPESDFDPEGLPRLTLRMVARLQGFPDSWIFAGPKTGVYRQIGNAFPPPVAFAVGMQIVNCLTYSSDAPWEIQKTHADSPVYRRTKTLSHDLVAVSSTNK